VPGVASPYRWEGVGVQVYARSLHDNRSRIVDFTRGTSDHKNDSMTLFVGCTLPGGEADRIVEMDNFEARDEHGATIYDRRQGSRLDHAPGNSGPFPDEWHTLFLLKGVSAEAERLEWVEADLYEYADYQTGEITIDLPVSRARRKVRLWDMTLELVAYEAGENIESDDKDNDCGPNRHRLRMILRKPKDVRVATPGDDSSIKPMLLDSGGRPFENAGTELGGMDFPGHDSLEIEAHFTPRRRSPARVVLQLARKADPRKRLRFRLENIPLR
jgi:hypothetical protein